MDLLMSTGSRNDYRAAHILAFNVFMLLLMQLLLLLHDTSHLSRLILKVSSNHSEFGKPRSKIKTAFPRNIWTTSRSGPGNFDDWDRSAVKTWTKLNQKWPYESMTQYSAESYVRERFASDPEITEIFIDLQDPILRADVIRYLVLLGDGGLYTDLDTKSLKPIDDWIPSEYKDKTNVVIGIEYDSLREDRWVDWTLDLQFSTWAILANPNHPLLEYTVQEAIRGLKALAFERAKTISALQLSREEVLDTTGPALFTRAVFDFLSRSTGTHYTWENFTSLQEPLLVGDILILPITAFGCGQTHSNAGGADEEQALVEHLFKGSWKSDHVWEKGFRDEWSYENEDEDEGGLELQGERLDENDSPGAPDRDAWQDGPEEWRKTSAEDVKDG